MFNAWQDLTLGGIIGSKFVGHNDLGTPENFLASIKLASARIWIRSYESTTSEHEAREALDALAHDKRRSGYRDLWRPLCLTVTQKRKRPLLEGAL
jgi:hypothetical protein